jgi:NAD(P)-dependent dehydrogenase (short-subunit alcohol dehydrogenase family)
MRFGKRIALVTGAGAGIGRAIAAGLAAEGAYVYVTDADLAAAEAAADEIAVMAGEAVALPLDVTQGADIAAVVARIAADHRRLDLLVNNAGINVREDFRHLKDEDWERLSSINIDGTVRLSRDCFELLRLSGRGAVLNLASILASRGTRQAVAYSATKGAVAALTRGLAVEYGHFSIRVNYLAPGFIETALTDRALKNPGIAKALLERTPLRRFGTAEDVAKAALFLLSDDAAFITGAGLAIDGGMAAML